MDAMIIGKFISELRKERGLKQKELAEILTVSDKAISRWETGKGIPDVASLEGLSEYFGVTINELLVGKRVEQKDIGEVADETVKQFVKKEKSMKRKLAIIVGILVVLVLVFMICTLPAVKISNAVGISEDNWDELFDYVEKLERQEKDYTVTVDTENKSIVISSDLEEWIGWRTQK